MGVLMEATPSDVSYDIVKETFLSVDGIKQIHNLRIWGLTTDMTVGGTGGNICNLVLDL